MNENIGEKTNNELPQKQNDQWDTLKNQPMSKTFQVAPGTTKEAEFKRLTGEDWPGKKYIAETSGADNFDGYDYPIETWTIRERTAEEQSGIVSREESTVERIATSASSEKRTPDEVEEQITASGIANHKNADESRLVGSQVTEATDKIITPEGAETTKQQELDSARQQELDSARQQELDSARQQELDSARQQELDSARQQELDLAKQKESELALIDELLAEQAKDDARLAEIDKEIAELDEMDFDKPLVAINADFSHDKNDLAYDLAERNLNDELSNVNGVKGYIKRLWKGTLFKKYYEQSYANDYMEGNRVVKIDGEEFNLDELMERRKDDAITRFVMSVTEDSKRFIHKRAGEEMLPADKEATEKVRAIIEKFATAQDMPATERKRMLSEELGRLRAEYKDNKREVDQSIFDNYELVAEQAFDRVRHGIAIKDVMDGFQVYNAKVRDGARTKAHRDAIDKISSSAIGQFLPVSAETLADAYSVATVFAQTGARAALRVTGGIFASGLISGLREQNRIAEDRARRTRDMAEGMSYEEENRNTNKRTAKYEANIGGTIYELKPANELIDNIEKAFDQEGEGRDEALLRAIAEARVRIDLSDLESKDLISYTSAEKRGDERLKLDIATIRAEKALSTPEKRQLKTLKVQIAKEIINEIDELDSEFNTMRAYMALKKASKTLLLGMTGIAFGPETARTGLGSPAGSIVEDNNTIKNDDVEEEPSSKDIEPESSSDVATEQEQFSKKMIDLIKTNEDLIGGEEGVKLLTDTTKYNNAFGERFGNYWDSLSIRERKRVIELINQINSSEESRELDWGSGARVWLTAHS
ncbi:hypothetical protein J5868_03490 [Candidatus Saccharibacteria bacterium]|nr:hypothetical protein [Candidatus Saccharibacteria bacterium]